MYIVYTHNIIYINFITKFNIYIHIILFFINIIKHKNYLYILLNYVPNLSFTLPVSKDDS